MSPPPLNYQNAAPTKKTYECGTLRYTTFGLIMLLVCLLWGDFIFTLMDGAVPGILPLKLNQMGAGDLTNILLKQTLSYIIVFLFAPAASLASDRHRGRWGRRIPFLFWSTPFVGMFMILIGCHEGLSSLVMGQSNQLTFHLIHFSIHLSRMQVSLIIFGALFAGYDFANIFVNTIYWYLFNDVVPPQFMSRFLALFRIVGTLAGMTYSKWIFPYALDRFGLIFVLAGIAYVIGFMLMCIFVKEGEYPPPPPLEPTPNVFASTWQKVKMFARECFTHRFYWYFFLFCACDALAGQVGMFGNLREVNSLHLSLKQLGDLGFLTGGVSLWLQFPAGWLADKWGPLRIYVVNRGIGLVGAFIPVVWIFKDFGVAGDLRLKYFLAFTFMPFGLLAGAAELPVYMQVLPRKRYGQFCSANAMFRALLCIGGSFMAGWFMKIMAAHESVKDWHYRMMPIWSLTFLIPSYVFILLLFNFWRKNGAEKFIPPGSQEPNQPTSASAFPVIIAQTPPPLGDPEPLEELPLN